MSGPNVLCVDAGFAATGIAVLCLGMSDEGVIALDVIRTEKDQKKRNTLAADDNMRRTREIVRALDDYVTRYQVVAFAIEAESAMRNASSAAKVSKAHAAVGAVAELRGLPIVSASPQRIRKVLCGNMRATDDDIEHALLARYGNGIESLFTGPEGLRVHAYDALAAGVTGLDSDVIRLARQMAKVA